MRALVDADPKGRARNPELARDAVATEARYSGTETETGTETGIAALRRQLMVGTRRFELRTP